MNQDYPTFNSLSKVKQKILSLNSMNDSAELLEHLIQNALEIMKSNDLSTDDLKHTFYNKEMAYLLDCQINKDRIDYFEKVIEFCKREIPDKELSIESIPEKWRHLPVDRTVK